MTTGTMPGMSHDDEDPQGDEVKVFKTSEEHPENEQHTSVATLYEDKAEIVFCADVEGNEPSTSTAAPPTVVKPQPTNARTSAAEISPNHPVPSKNGPSLGRTHLVNGSIGSKPQTAFVPANKHHQPSVTSAKNAGQTTDASSKSSQQGQNSLGSNSSSTSSTVSSTAAPPSSLAESMAAANNLAAAAAAAAAAANVPNGFLPNSSPAFLFWPAPGYNVLGQPFALPATSPLFFSGLPRPGAPAGGPPPAHSGGALAVDPSKIGSPTYTSPFYPPSAGYSPSFELPPFTPGLVPNLARFSPMPLLPTAAASPANLSPLHSPQTGTPIVPGVPRQTPDLGSAQSLRFAQDYLNLANLARNQAAMAANAGTNVSLPPSLNFRVIPASPLTGHPLASMASLKLPSVTTTVTSLATTLAAQPANGGMMPNQQILRRSTNERMMSGKMTNGRRSSEDENKKLAHIKKPLNAFMLFMKENRTKLMEEKGYKERQSAELNKELGRLWHTLTHEDQQKYYQMAREERQKHLQLYPGWSARDNYAVHKKKKRKRDKTLGDDNLELKKCRARFGLDQQVKWCKHCRRKKKCLWFREGGGSGASGQGNNPGSSEQSPVQVSSTTQGSPLDAEAAKVADGAPASKILRGSTSSDVSSPSAVSSTTRMHPGAAIVKSSPSDDDVTDDDDGMTSDEDFDDDMVDFSIEELEAEEFESNERKANLPVNKENRLMTSFADVKDEMASSRTPPTADHVTVVSAPTAATACK